MDNQREAHLLTALKRSGAPPCVVTVAISHGRKDTKNGYETTFQAAAARHQCRLNHFHTGGCSEDFVTDDINAFWDWIGSRNAKSHRLILVAVDLQHVLQSAGGFDHLPARGWHGRRLNMDAGGSGSVWWNDGRRIVMCDLLTWIPKPIATIRRLADGRRLRRLTANGEWTEAETEAAEDCAAISAIWDDIAEWIDRGDLGEWRTTGAGMAFSNFRHRHLTHPMACHNEEDRLAVERYSAFGGRGEAYHVGKVPKGPFYEWDLAAAYARVCRDTWLPVRDSGTSQSPTRQQILSPRVGLSLLIEAEVATEVPTLPWEDATGICWPVGTFRGVWWDRELRQAIHDGATVRPIRSWRYRSAPALAEWAEWILGALGGREPDMTPVRTAVVKHWSRALIGRFSLRYRVFEYVGESLEPGKWFTSTMTPERGQFTYLISTPDRLYMQNGWTESGNSIPAVLSYVMMETRMRLWDVMTKVGLDNVIHCDTDGLIVNKTGNAIMEGLALDGWRRKGTWRKLHVYGSRRLNGDLDRRLPGVPKTAIEVRGGGFIGDVRLSGTESMARGEVSTITVNRRKFTNRSRETRRIIGNNGRTCPVTVTNNERQTFNK